MVASAATEQLYMQRLQGTVELELSRRPFSSVGEVRGMLTPVAEAPHIAGAAVNHHRFSILAAPDGSDSDWRAKRHANAVANELPPVELVRHVSILPPLSLSAMLFGESTLTRYLRKSKHKTEFLRATKEDFLRNAYLRRD